MPLADDLIAVARNKILVFQAMPGGQAAIRQAYLNMWALRPDGLAVMSRASIDMQDFAEAIEPNRPQLRPWILVYAAAAGALGPWETVVARWTQIEITNDAIIPQEIEELIASLFTGYARLVAI